MMSMSEIIRKRRSVRKYDPSPLDAQTLEKINELIGSVKPLFPNIHYSIGEAKKVKGLFGIKAPHYLVFRSEKCEGSNENIGFVGQQLDLLFSEMGIGTCWLGASKEVDAEPSKLPQVICMSFGKPDGSLHRNLSEFKRKPLSAISEGSDPRLEAARLAPSGINTQGWYFIAENGKIHCYRKKPGLLLKAMFANMGAIDIGIAICHIAMESKDFSFAKEPDVPNRDGFIYVGTVIGG